MGHPQRQAQSTVDDDPFVSIQDWFDDEESGPWCVDNGAAIEVMRTRAIYDAVERGDLTPDMKVWRDGRACWLAIAECYELTVKPPSQPERLSRTTPVSGVRRVKRAMVSTIPNAPPAKEKTVHKTPIREAAHRSTMMLGTSFAIGIVIGALLYLPFAW